MTKHLEAGWWLSYERFFDQWPYSSLEVLEGYTIYGLTILHTDERGAIKFGTDGIRLWVETTY